MAREEPAAFTLLWRHAAREPQFAEYAHELRSISVEVLRQFVELDSGDTVLDVWLGDALFGWLVETTLSWLELGDAGLDEEFVDRVTDGLSSRSAAPGPAGQRCTA